jgi:hypothetical protein
MGEYMYSKFLQELKLFGFGFVTCTQDEVKQQQPCGRNILTVVARSRDLSFYLFDQLGKNQGSQIKNNPLFTFLTQNSFFVPPAKMAQFNACNNIWTERAFEGVFYALKLLQEQPNIAFVDLYLFLSAYRAYIDVLDRLEEKNPDLNDRIELGIPRYAPCRGKPGFEWNGYVLGYDCSTSLTGHYSAYQAVLAKYLRDFYRISNPFTAFSYEVEKYGIKLSTLEFHQKIEDDLVPDNEDTGLIIKHTSTNEAIKAMENHIIPLFNKLIAYNVSDATRNVFLDDLANFTWFMAHAMLCKRGSSAITQMILATLLIKKGFLPIAWGGEATIDLEAIFMPLDNFTENFKKELCFVNNRCNS